MVKLLDSKYENKVLGFFLLLWTILNITQAYTLGIHSDEAYYWVYSKLLDWGYYDHPPMVAIFIFLGDHLVHNELGVRLTTVLTSTISLYLIWLIVKEYKARVEWFILIVFGTFIFHIYGFITTPDAPLFFFSVLFYYLYRQYLANDTWTMGVLLSLVIACLLYSKYHSILLILFTVISNVKLVKRPTFWLIIILSSLLYLPHILWQVNHGFPSMQYHIFERSSTTYNPAHTYFYPLGQLLMSGPLIGWYLFYYIRGIKITDAFIRCLVVNCIGIFVFFFLSTIKGNVQPHWTLIGYIPFVILVFVRSEQRGGFPKWLKRVAIINLCLIFAFRILLVLNFQFVKNIKAIQSFYGYQTWETQIHKKAGQNYVVIPGGFQDPSKYNFYSNSIKALAYDQRSYRRTQYDIWPIEDSLQHKSVYYLSGSAIPELATEKLLTEKGPYYGAWVKDLRTYQRVNISNKTYDIKVGRGANLTFDLSIYNPYSQLISFSNKAQLHQVNLDACFFQGDDEMLTQRIGDHFNEIKIESHKMADLKVSILAPAIPGKYDLIFSIKTTPFPGGRNSRIIKVNVY